MYTDKNGNIWYKGNLHSHTKISDGRYEPADTLKLYRDHGYDFIALTDHYKYGVGGVDEATGILVLPGVEYDTGSHPSEGIYHIICVCANSEPVVDRTNGKPDVQTIVNAVKDAGGVAILAHPAWSFNDPKDVEQIKGIDATEIYNTVSGKPWNIRPYSGLFVDRMAADGFDLGIVAADDVHFYNGDQCRSYVLVNAKENTRESLREALLCGNFVATQGPFISIEKTDEGIRADLVAYSRHVDQYDGWINDMHSKVNDTFLKSNGQEAGVASYGLMVNLLVAWAAGQGSGEG